MSSQARHSIAEHAVGAVGEGQPLLGFQAERLQPGGLQGGGSRHAAGRSGL